jgi:predicted nucleic acid-binding protein
VKYLLDVNVLISLGHLEHAHHASVAHWLRAQQSSQLLTCSITELGFVRILAQAPAYGFTVAHAQALLGQLKQARGYSFTFIPDTQDVSHLPEGVKTSGQTTDGHLVQLANAHGAILATLDAKIPGAFVIS